MQKITPFLWFNDQAEAAMNFYTAVFKNSKVIGVNHYGEGAPLPKGTVMTASFTIEDQQFVALNGGPYYTITPAISFVVNCNSQEEIDYYWEKLSESGKEIQCGWLTDKFGVSWQIVPAQIGKLMSSGSPERSQRVMNALMKMIKIDLNELQRAYDEN
jgi:predicted 3-demethylubiquinone-9 3-methyltransferase (glyoxalase superfamily)